MAIKLGSAYGKVSIDASGVKAGVGTAVQSLQNLSAVGQTVGPILQDVGRAMTIGLTLPILAMGATSIKAASDMVETKSKVKVVFGEMSDAVMEWSKNSATAMLMSRQEALESAGTFGNLFVSMKIGKKESADMSTALVQLAADLGSMNNIDPSIVFVKLRSGMVGETEAVRDLGIDLRAVRVEAKAMEMGFQKINGQFSQGSLIAARYALIMEDTKTAQGDVARTGDEVAGQVRKLNAQFKDALEMLGTNFLPIALKVVQAVNGMLETFNKMSPGMQKAVIVFAGLVGAAGPVIYMLGTIVGFVAGLISIGTALGGLGISFGAVAAAAGTAATAIIGFGASAIAALLPILLPIALLIVAIGLLYLAFKKNFMGITTAFQNLGENLKRLWAMTVGYMTSQFVGFATSVMSIINAVSKAWAAFIAWVQKPIKWPKLPDWLKPGSPTPFEMGLRGIVSALQSVDMASKPEMFARTMARPVQNMSSSSSSTNVFNLSGGLTMRDVDRLMDEKINRFTGQLTKAMG